VVVGVEQHRHSELLFKFYSSFDLQIERNYHFQLEVDRKYKDLLTNSASSLCSKQLLRSQKLLQDYALQNVTHDLLKVKDKSH
jgi:hypothetical protein